MTDDIIVYILLLYLCLDESLTVPMKLQSDRAFIDMRVYCSCPEYQFTGRFATVTMKGIIKQATDFMHRCYNDSGPDATTMIEAGKDHSPG